jgi:hypothetical protein
MKARTAPYPAGVLTGRIRLQLNDSGSDCLPRNGRAPTDERVDRQWLHAQRIPQRSRGRCPSFRRPHLSFDPPQLGCFERGIGATTAWAPQNLPATDTDWTAHGWRAGTSSVEHHSTHAGSFASTTSVRSIPSHDERLRQAASGCDAVSRTPQACPLSTTLSTGAR